MSEALRRIEGDVITAMKSGDRTRLDILRVFVNRVKMTAKNDGNRDVRDEDVVTAGLKIVKEANETRDIYVSRNVATVAQDTEIAVVSEYLPKQMSEDELRTLVGNIVSNLREQGNTATGKALMGPIMKTLNGSYKGQFDQRAANQIVGEFTA